MADWKSQVGAWMAEETEEWSLQEWLMILVRQTISLETTIQESVQRIEKLFTRPPDSNT